MEAPLSLTNVTTISRGSWSERTKSIVSRPYVPLPMAIASMLNFWQSATILPAASRRSASDCESWTTVSKSSLPWGSRQTILQPVRMPGSIASTALRPSGAAISSSRRLAEKTPIASSPALRNASMRVSTSIEGAMSRV